jgi:serine/threonine protein kinase
VVERRLARGGASVPYLARDASGRRVVLKIVPAEAATRALRARLAREARALSSIEHPGLVRVLGTGEHAGAPWIATDYVHGVDLARVLAERGPLPSDLALRYVIQAAEALAAAHQAGVVHCNLKTSSLLLASGGRVVLVDFGASRRRPEGRDGDTGAGVGGGAGVEPAEPAAYLSPEQIEHGLADERSDVWALGCVLYELVVGAPPFGRIGPLTTEAVLHQEPVFPPQVPAAVVDVVSACLRKSSFSRVASPRELLPMLRDALTESRGSSASGTDRVSLSPGDRISALPGDRISTFGERISALPDDGSLRPARDPSSGAFRRASPARSLSGSPPRPFASAPPAAPAAGAPRSSGAMRAAPGGRVKGAALRAALAWFAEQRGPEGLARVVELASPELRALLRPGDPACGIIASTWYEAGLVGELIGALERVAAPPDLDAYQSQLAQAVARDNVGGVYRALFRLVATPPLLEANAQRVWQTYVDEGTLTIRIQGPGAFRAYVRRWDRHQTKLCELLGPLIEEMLRAIGYSGLVVERTQCVDDGHGECVFEGQWLP